LAEAFHSAHEERYGFAQRDREIELVAVRTADVKPPPAFELATSSERRVSGPAVEELPGATAWIPAGWSGITDPHGTLILRPT
jgi:hypothetical protein